MNSYEKQEQIILKQIIKSKDFRTEMREIMAPLDFLFPNNLICETIYEMMENGEEIDMVSLTRHLKKRTALDIVGGASYISSLFID